MQESVKTPNPSLMPYKLFPLLFSDFRFSFAPLCTTNFYLFDFSERHFLVLQSFVNFVGSLCLFTAKPHMHLFSKSIGGFCSDGLLR